MAGLFDWRKGLAWPGLEVNGGTSCGVLESPPSEDMLVTSGRPVAISSKRNAKLDKSAKGGYILTSGSLLKSC